MKKKEQEAVEGVRDNAAGKITITCQHCRYERPAGDIHCHICGYPWAWAEKPKTKRNASAKK